MATAKSLTIKQALVAFGVAHMTLHNWRKGSPTKEPLPFEVDNPEAVKPRVSFKLSTTKAWARKHKIEFAFDPELAAEGKEPKKAPTKTVRATKRAKH